MRHNHGLNVDPLNALGRPDPILLRGYGFTSVRLVPRPDPIVIDYYLRCIDAGLDVDLVLARESFSAFQMKYVDALTYYVVNFPRVRCWIVGNEPDAGVDNDADGDGIVTLPERMAASPSSWVMSQDAFYLLWSICHTHLQTVGVNRILVGAMVSGQPGWLDPIVGRMLQSAPDGWCVHPYAKNADEARELLRDYRGKVQGAPLYITEWNRPVEQIPAFVGMLQQETAGDQWFCWSDGMVEGFGLTDTEEHPKQEFQALIQAINGETVVIDPEEIPEDTPEEIPEEIPWPDDIPIEDEPPPQPVSSFVVGSDVLKKMAELGDVPASDEVYFHNRDGRTMWSETKGTSGNTYYWVFSTKKVSVYFPDA